MQTPARRGRHCLTFFRLVGALFALLGLGSCTDSTPIFALAPEIEFVSLVRETPRTGFAPNEVLSTFTPSGESMLLTVNFKDGDGDVGGQPNSQSPFTWIARDIRPSLPSAYPYTTITVIDRPGPPPVRDTILTTIADTTLYSGSLPNLVSDNRKPSIEGSIVYRINAIESLPIGVCGSNPTLRQEAVFEVYILDRAGNRSNTIRTTPIFIRCQ